jgi:Zn-dependent M28 family amino/carboxypeptidase
VSAKTSFIEDAKGYNELGYLPGSDFQKAVVIGAHYDHIGKDADGTVFRGANDDASGVGVMMEIARVFSVGAKPKPSILFAAWSGEEQCLCGSYAYVNRPYFSLANTVADLTLDMVGAGGALSAQISDTYTALRSTTADSAKQLQISLDVEGFSGGSDHAPFQEKHVPNLMFIYEPLDEVYHTPADTVDHISTIDLANTAKLTSLITLKLTEATITASASTGRGVASINSTSLLSTTTSHTSPLQAMTFTAGPITGILITLTVVVIAAALTFVVLRRRK